MNVKIGKNMLGKLDGYLKDTGINNLYIITDENINRLYYNSLQEALKEYNYNNYAFPPGEKSKSIYTVLSIYDNLIKNNIDRNTLIIGLGGGVVGDIAGFVASTFKRGINYIQIPTTLLAQVDSSIGGKVGIDYGGLKNVIGSFYFPNMIIIDILFLETLSNRDIICGLGEVFKYGLIADYNLFEFTSINLSNIYRKDEDILLNIINRSVAIKKDIVYRDKYDEGIRRILNFGHTIGHGIEAYYKFNKFNHGEAVILGMIYESHIAKGLGLIDERYFEKIYKVLKKLIVPIKFNIEEIKSLIKIMENDKKNVDGKITFVLPTGKGQVDLFNDIDEELIISSLKGGWF
ncbi:3-dehydroquinate synthase [[Clostridium] ultunense Esp]|uniref:3-dehydroquinate synthase n=1 Tax=[Clostridium] ultunense Esp TaxID=1288971 RepID=M1YZ58_9FIRM|nr:3-dehydroquinate synthase [Schnuerera ultunensis]CCQ95870.1 3-dehydroquinate synthase [[Clostridium] ultunense Esp]SHD77307.1 3-dehydroquinate synthase [[Clostridium] ultunense Esp]